MIQAYLGDELIERGKSDLRAGRKLRGHVRRERGQHCVANEEDVEVFREVLVTRAGAGVTQVGTRDGLMIMLTFFWRGAMRHRFREESTRLGRWKAVLPVEESVRPQSVPCSPKAVPTSFCGAWVSTDTCIRYSFLVSNRVIQPLVDS